ncbi:N-acyl-D-amino-acid deacylase family protein [Planococcus beigongshangi]|uniref:N-acyl-D-amino-acid deacylase family protein n=1 Tax=Planococcus beigongshangi TaxID=2782536 RepID=UPI00193B8DC7|nr:D-aminoacylase [Planococcus beigongshangi]
MYDLLLTNGRIIDGSGAKSYIGSIAIKDNKIVKVSPVIEEESLTTVNVEGSCVSPGFIDAHTHDDLAILEDGSHAPKLFQGVTTAVLGNCGHGCAPVGNDLDALRNYSEPVLGRFTGKWDWKSFDDYIERLIKAPKTVNTVSQVAHGAVRSAVMGFDGRSATKKEIDLMVGIVSEAMEAGAVGLSLGLMYAPGSYADKEELVALGKVVGKFGGVLNCHLRSEGNSLIESMDEFFTIGEEAEVSLHISHLKSVGLSNFGKLPSIIEKLDRKRSEGVDITCDVYPYPAGSTTIVSLIPLWAIEGGTQQLLRRLQNPALRKQIKFELKKPWGQMENNLLGIGYERIRVCGLRNISNLIYEGMSLSQIAERKNEPLDECLLQLIEEEEGKASIILFQMAEEDVQEALSWKWSMIGSDGLPLDSKIIHPRHYGTFPRVLGHYSRDKDLFSLEEGVRKMTSLPSERFNLKKRGRIQTGYVSDLVVFSSNNIKDLATFEKPRVYPEGIKFVYINGEQVVEIGKTTGKYPGKHLLNSLLDRP